MYRITASRARRTGAEPEEPLTIQDYHGPEKLFLQPFFVRFLWISPDESRSDPQKNNFSPG
jgi:hypothetical protein